ncbi:MAG: YidC/Oxa1 family insertase periplasmic-domain containing protein, partial [Prevotella salivae]|nr:YidC/Oxa1 family insertase periplasmic-domain containing protein [Segatella salivae]
MDKNNIIGFLLIAAVLIGFSWYNQPSAEEQRAAFVKDSIEQVNKSQSEKAAQMEKNKRQQAEKQKVLSDTTSLFHKALTGNVERIVLKNKKVELTFSSKGAYVEQAIIKGYVGHNIKVKNGSADKKNLTLFSGADQSISYLLNAKETNINTAELYFVPSEVSDSTVTFIADAGEGKSLTLKYALGQDYMLHMQMSVQGMAGLFAPGT